MPHPIVVAHRGANIDIPEQTLAAYSRAIELGADGIECDVRFTRDGHLVCHHDRTIERTSNGTGSISRLTLAQLQEFEFSGKHGPETGRHQITTFASLLELVNAAGRPVTMLIETKHPSRYGAKVEEAVHAALADYPDIPAVVMSFSRAAVTRYRRLDPSIDLVWLYEYALGAPPSGATVIGPRLDQVHNDPGLIARHQAKGRRVFVWTVNTAQDVKLVAEAGADAIITDDPELVMATLNTKSV
ncbi:MAG TPA: hypothetical protein H9902_06350 [Candidatus Stackebrandtia faecavium]|nr:hypothetical protein [Candidatus Stackebrandtia faecavium]